jgi:prolipoprotein diacylglyceryltransferase
MPNRLRMLVYPTFFAVLSAGLFVASNDGLDYTKHVFNISRLTRFPASGLGQTVGCAFWGGIIGLILACIFRTRKGKLDDKPPQAQATP